MSDHGSAGRMVNLVPITWDDGFPVIGLPGNLRRAPNTWVKPNTGYTQDPNPTYVWDDNFDSGKLNPHWQWNHVPDDTKWSLTDKPGVLRMHSLPATDFYSARNSVCQRPPAPESIITVELDTTGMVAGDTAGLGLLSTPYAWIGVVKTAEGSSLQMVQVAGGRRRGGDAAPANTPVVGTDNPPSHLWLRMSCNFDTDQVIYSWSDDGKEFVPVGNPFTPTFQWINLMRGDTMLMTLVNHRYLGTKPNAPGQVVANVTGPTPARKGGACFKWTLVE
jgi:xylan 1,4-beta-xylosidase